MSPLRPLRLLAACLTWLTLGPLGHADPLIAPEILDPRTTAEAWNVIRLATANVDRLIAEQRLREIPVQISYCSPALRLLGRAPEAASVQPVIERTSGWISALAAASQENNAIRAASSREQIRAHLAEIARHFPPPAVAAEIYFCPRHPGTLTENAEQGCLRCGARLIPRRIPYSALYVRPGAATVRFSGQPSAPLVAGQTANITVRFTRQNGAPLGSADLLVAHSQPIHLLITDAGRRTFQRVHPQATSTPGEFTFSFTPQVGGPHRVWADVIPAETALQELPFIDLPGAESVAGAPLPDEQLSAELLVKPARGTFGDPAAAASRLSVALALSQPPLIAGQTGGLQVTVKTADGQPFSQLEPLLNSFAHLTGIYDDHTTVVPLHVGNGEIFLSEARGGPSLRFSCYPPRAGKLRLFCELQVQGTPVVAAFSLVVESPGSE